MEGTRPSTAVSVFPLTDAAVGALVCATITTMSVSFERPHTFAEGNWSSYMTEMGEHVENEKWDDLEALLEMEHPTLPGELEAFQALREAYKETGRELHVRIDPHNPNHIVPTGKAVIH